MEIIFFFFFGVLCCAFILCGIVFLLIREIVLWAQRNKMRKAREQALEDYKKHLAELNDMALQSFYRICKKSRCFHDKEMVNLMKQELDRRGLPTRSWQLK